MASQTETGRKALDDEATSTATSQSNSSTAVRPGQASPVDAFAGRVLSHYRLDEQLGAGGMGVLYRANDLTLERAVAIKLLARPLATDETAKARFVQEARAASALDHPNIANIHDIGEVDGELFIVMALYEGETLKQRLKKGPLQVNEVVRILGQLALGLEAAHRAGIVHRDIKPANILLTSGGTVKILDFGVAKLLNETQSQLTDTGHAVGTALYMSPEQLGGRPVDARNDLWSVGVVAHELISGVSPFHADSSPATIARILHDEPVSLTSVPGVPGWLALLVSRLLRKNPAERPQSAGELLSQLDQHATATSENRALVGSSPLRAPWRTAVGLVFAMLIAAAGGWALWTWMTKHPADVDRSIAVLPFASLSKGEENAYLAEGFHDELLRQIGKIGDLRVISRTSVLQYKPGARNLREIAEALGVSSIVEGTVQREGQRVRVAATLVDARSDRQLWANRYDEDASDLFAIQTAVAEAIANALKARLSPGQKSNSRESQPRALKLPSEGLWNPAIVNIMTHHPQEALPILEALEPKSLGNQYAVYPKTFLLAGAHQALGETEKAQKEYEAAIPLLEAEVQKRNPPPPNQHPLLAYAYAGVGRKEDALREAGLGAQLIPVSEDAYLGATMQIWRAAVEARVGDKDAAIDRIRYLLSIPSYLSPGLLRIDPFWTPLREDPRFRKLAELDHP